MSRKLQINLLVPSFFPATRYGGPIISTLNLCKSLSALGHKVFVSTTDVDGPDRLKVEANSTLDFEDSFKIIYYKSTFSEKLLDVFSISLIIGLWKDIKKNDVTLTQGIFSFTTPLALLYCFLQNKVCVVSPRGALSPSCLNLKKSHIKKLWLNFLIKPFSKYCLWHTTSCKETEDLLSICPDVKTFISPNGVNIAEYSKINELSSEDYTNKFLNQTIQSRHIVISMGRLHTVKGFDILINAFYEVRLIKTDAILIIAGPDGGAKADLLLLIDKLNLQNSVFLIDPVYHQDKTDFLAGAQVFALPSHSENFGLVYAEALICGTPIVSSHGTPWEIVEAHNCGKWVPNSVAETHNAISNLLNEDVKALGQNGKQLIKSQFSWVGVTKNFMAELEKLLPPSLE